MEENIPSVTVNAPMLKRILMIVKEGHAGLVQTEVSAMLKLIDHEVLTPKWNDLVEEEVGKFISRHEDT